MKRSGRGRERSSREKGVGDIARRTFVGPQVCISVSVLGTRVWHGRKGRTNIGESMPIAARPPHPNRRRPVLTMRKGFISRRSPPGIGKLCMSCNLTRCKLSDSHILPKSRRGSDEQYPMFRLSISPGFPTGSPCEFRSSPSSPFSVGHAFLRLGIVLLKLSQPFLRVRKARDRVIGDTSIPTISALPCRVR